MTATTAPAGTTAAAPTAVRLDLGLYPDIQRFGAADISACFSCGTCSATCPMSQTDGTFPRRIIRYAQLGMKDALLGSKELWACYQCGECAETCPTQADPSEFMAATRRYAIASYDKTHLARTMYTRPVLATVVAVAPGRVLRGVHVRRPRADGRRDPRDLRVDPVRADPRHGHRGDDPRRARGGRGHRVHGPRHRATRGREPALRAGLARGPRADGPRPVVRRRARVARPGPLPRGVRGRRRRHGRALVPAPLAGPRAGRVGLPGPARWPPGWTGAWRCWASRRPGRRCRSGTRSGSWAPSPAPPGLRRHRPDHRPLPRLQPEREDLDRPPTGCCWGCCG